MKELELEQRIQALEEQVKSLSSNLPAQKKSGTLILVFSGETDKVLTALNIALGELSSGNPATFYFTFWGVTAMRKPGRQSGPKHWIQKIFGWLLPKGISQLPLSKMNFLGIGPLLLKYLMKHQKLLDLEELLQLANSMNAKFYICSMTMDFMGFKEEELRNDIKFEYCGVAKFLESAKMHENTFII